VIPAMNEITDKCAHAACHCPARMDSGYCCEYCKTAEDDFERGCLCGHPECQRAALRLITSSLTTFSANPKPPSDCGIFR
jgi:hypothetical protein